MICDIPDETVKVFVGCLELTIFLVVTIGVAQSSAGVRVTLALSSK